MTQRQVTHSTTHPVKSTHFSLVSHNKEDSLSLFPLRRTRIVFQMLRVMLSVMMSARSSFEQNYPSLREDLYLHCLWLIGRRKNIFLPRSPQPGPGYSRVPRKELQGDRTVRTRNNLCLLKEQPHHHQQPLPHPNEHHEHEDSPRLRDRNS